MRLIDELTLQRELFCRIQENAIDSGTVHFDSYKNWCLSGSEVEKAISDIFSQVDPFCPTIDPESLPIVQELREQLARVTAERDAAITDMEALMWFSGEGCRICSHCIEVHKTPYVRLDCNLRPKKDCTPEWRGIQEAQQDEQL